MHDSTSIAAPDFRLSSVAGRPLSLDELCKGGAAVVVFASEECPTSAMTIRRLGPLQRELSTAGIALAVVFEDPLEVAARAARRAGFRGIVLSEPAPYEVSGAYQLMTVPTT
ncbi:MAG: redoxin domain-containing protein, partial [Solirubrobacteraceae bacterium]